MVAAGDARPESTLYFDDSTRNVAAGAEMGLYSVLVGRRDANVGADLEVRTYWIPSPGPCCRTRLEQTFGGQASSSLRA